MTTTFESIVDHLYKVDADDKKALAELEPYLDYPAQFPPWETILIATMAKQGTGRQVLVFETRCPASFFRIVVLPDADQPGLIYDSGTGQQELVAKVASLLHRGEEFPAELSEELSRLGEEQMLVRKPFKENYLEY